MNLGTTRLRGRPRNRWQDEVMEDGKIVCGERWQDKIHNREEWKKLLRTTRNRRILHMAKEWMNECIPSARTAIKSVVKENIVFMLVSVGSKWDVILHVTFHDVTLMKYLNYHELMYITQFHAVFSSFLPFCLLYTLSFHPSPPSSLPSSLTSSCHLFLGLPLILLFPNSYIIYPFGNSISFHSLYMPKPM